MQNAPDALVLGGGLAGGMVALQLSRAGRAVVLLERTKGEHHKVCGEFLSSEAVRYLQSHNVDLAMLGAVPLETVRLILPKAVVEDALPFPAYSITRRLLDEQLLRRAADAGAEIQRDCWVESLEAKVGGWRATLRDGSSLCAPHVFLATGKHDLRGWPRPEGKHAGLVAMKMYFRLTPEQHTKLGRAIELMLFPGGYAGLQPVESGMVNLCLVVSTEQFQSVGRDWRTLLQNIMQYAPHLAQRLEGSTPVLAAPLAAFHIPYGHIQRDTASGLWRVGDQAAVIPSFCGDGMAIALHSAALAAKYFLEGGSSRSYQLELRTQLSQRLTLATMLSRFLVRFPGAAQLGRVFPALLRYIALATRVPERALLASHHEKANLAVSR